MLPRQVLLASSSAVMLALTACGGGGVESTPPPPPTPTPTPTPTPGGPPPVPTGPIGLTGASSFSTYAGYVDSDGKLVTGKDAVELSYSAADDSYTIKLPAFEQGKLQTVGGNGSWDGTEWTHLLSTSNKVTAGDLADWQPVDVTLDWPASSELKYTSMGNWTQPDSGLTGVFVYGIPTAAGDVPVSGSADYAGDVRGLTDNRVDVFGTINLSFDFAGGTLGGKMELAAAGGWDPVPLGTYTFANTVFSRGSTSFSGSFNAPSGVTGASSFQGSFTGPGAAELMGSWMAPYADPTSGTPGTMSGVFAGTKGK